MNITTLKKNFILLISFHFILYRLFRVEFRQWCQFRKVSFVRIASEKSSQFCFVKKSEFVRCQCPWVLSVLVKVVCAKKRCLWSFLIRVKSNFLRLTYLKGMFMFLFLVDLSAKLCLFKSSPKMRNDGQCHMHSYPFVCGYIEIFYLFCCKHMRIA